MKVSIFLRKRIKGENSLEEAAQNIVSGIPYSKIMVFPEYFHNIIQIIKNIIFAKKHSGDVNHIFQPTGAFLCLFLKNTVVTYHDIFCILQGRGILTKIVVIFLTIYIPGIFAKKIICVSEGTRKEFLHYFNTLFVRKKIYVIYNINRPDVKYSPHIFNKECPKILHIGTAERKNLSRVITALSGIKCKLIIVGILSNGQKSLLEEHNLLYENYYDISYSEILNLYNISDIVSFPSLKEGFGIITIEAQAIGRAALSSNIEIIREIGADGYYEVDPYDTKSIRAGFIELINNDQLRENIINKGLKNSERFNFYTAINKHTVLYESLCKNKS